MPSNILEVSDLIKYSYLWWNEHRKGKKEGFKDRPCGVVLSRKTDQGDFILYVFPITHTPPSKLE